jgi:hypothetical protein
LPKPGFSLSTVERCASNTATQRLPFSKDSLLPTI